MPFEPVDPRLLDRAIAIARAAGEVIIPFHRTGADVRLKADASPVTVEDEAADALITRALRDLTPSTPVVSEESSVQFGGQAPADRFWPVDPLDGTKEFIGGRDEFSVNIALIEHGAPVLGVVLLPARGELYAGADGRGAFVVGDGDWRPIHCRALPADGDRAADGALLGGTRVAGEVQVGSALKFCLVACGTADVFPRAGRTMEWDTAAGQAVLIAAGGNVFDRNGAPLAYGKPGFENPSFIARGAMCPGVN